MHAVLPREATVLSYMFLKLQYRIQQLEFDIPLRRCQPLPLGMHRLAMQNVVRIRTKANRDKPKQIRVFGVVPPKQNWWMHFTELTQLCHEYIG